MNHDTPPAGPWQIEVRAMIFLYRPADLLELERYGAGTLPAKTATWVARWWLPLPTKGDTVGVGDDPEYLTVDRLEWWPAENTCVIGLEAVRVDSPRRFAEIQAAFAIDGWLTDAQWQARQAAP